MASAPASAARSPSRGRLHAALRRRPGVAGRWVAEVTACLTSAGSSWAPGDQRLGTFDAIAARSVYGDALLDDFPFSAFVSKTITPEPRAGNEPQRIWETPAGMINSIGLPNKGLDGFLAGDLPQLAELPVPLVVSVMGTSREEFARLVEGVGGARGGRRHRAQRLLPQRPLRPDRRRAAGRDRGPARGAAAADREAADREADSERRRPRRGRGRRRGGRGRRGLADQHAEGERDRSGDRRAGVAAGHGGLSGPAVRPVAIAAGARGGRGRRLPIVGMGGVSQRRRRARIDRRGGRAGRGRHRELSRPAGRRAGRRELAGALRAVARPVRAGTNLDSRSR